LLEECLAFSDYVDVELSSGGQTLRRLKTVAGKKNRKLIASYHGFAATQTARQLSAIVEKGARFGDVVKIAMTVKTEADSAALFQAMAYANSKGIKAVVIGMGKRGAATRLLGPLFCDSFGYFPLDGKSATAPGQVTAGAYAAWLGKAGVRRP
jgi:3-dehydroquinate dehydratase type I